MNANQARELSAENQNATKDALRVAERIRAAARRGKYQVRVSVSRVEELTTLLESKGYTVTQSKEEAELGVVRISWKAA